jgi:hypothetical protein
MGGSFTGKNTDASWNKKPLLPRCHSYERSTRIGIAAKQPN